MKHQAEAVKSTSGWMAAIRAEETSRADRYLIDPFARLLTDSGSHEQLRLLRQFGSPGHVIIIRGRFGDEAIRAAVTAGARQIVVLGSGSDTRGYRLDLPEDLDLYEVDLPGQLAAKHQRLTEAGHTPRCRHTPIDADLRGDWYPVLAGAGHRPDKSCVWIAEGLLYYLTPPAADALLDQISAHSATGSVLVFDVPDVGYGTAPQTAEFRDYMTRRGSALVGFMADPVASLAAKGWSAEAYLPEHLATCRWLPPIPERLMAPSRRVWFVRAVKR